MLLGTEIAERCIWSASANRLFSHNVSAITTICSAKSIDALHTYKSRNDLIIEFRCRGRVKGRRSGRQDGFYTYASMALCSYATMKEGSTSLFHATTPPIKFFTRAYPSD